MVVAIVALAIVAVACGGKEKKPASGTDVTVQVTTSPGAAIPRTLFGSNVLWENLGENIVQGGELVSDRSFTLFGANGSPWAGLPLGGTILHVSTGGDPAAGGSPGFVRISDANASELPLVSELLLGPVHAGTAYTLTFSSYGETGTPSILAALDDTSFTTALATPAVETTTPGAWKQHSLAIVPTTSADQALLVLALQNGGSVRVDEVRFSRAAAPSIDPAVASRIAAIGGGTLRYPGGTLADSFVWEASIGPLSARAEMTASFGRRQTASLGLDEFLRLCEQTGATPVLQVNALATTASAAALVQYVNGGAGTTMGALRAANGHAAAYGVHYFEIGNEPSANYAIHGDDANAGADYASLAAPIADAMRAEDPTIAIGGVAHTSFLLASFLPAVPILANWNDQVFTGAGSIAGKIDFADCHFYSWFGDDPDPAVRAKNELAGGSVLARTLAALAPVTGRPAYVTEYAATAADANGKIRASSLYDFTSGLVVADLTMTMASNGIAVAQQFNLSEDVGYGAFTHHGAWDARPSGLALEMLAPLAGEARLPVSIDANPQIAIDAATGNIPAGTKYGALQVLATSGGSGRRVAILNRSVDQDFTVRLEIDGAAAGTGTISRLESDSLTASNEDAPGTVTIAVSSGGAASVFVPRHSLVRIDLP